MLSTDLLSYQILALSDQEYCKFFVTIKNFNLYQDKVRSKISE